MSKVHTSALVIIPPENLWDPIQEIRREKDKAFSRWPPHVNLLYPFVSPEKFEDAVTKIQSSLKYTTPFTLSLNRLGHFEHGRQSTLYLEASVTEVNELQSLLFSIFPECDDLTKLSSSGFHGHLTLGQFPTTTIKQTIKEYSSKWTPITWTVSSINIISRNGNNPFEVIHTIPLKEEIREEFVHSEVESYEPQQPKWDNDSYNDEENEDWGNAEWEETNTWEQEYAEGYNESGYVGRDQNFPEEARELLNRLTSGNPKIPRKHAKPHTKKLYIERTCKECNSVLFKFEPSAMKQDRYFKLKELIAVHKHKFAVHDVEKSLFSLVDISAHFAKVNKNRRSQKQFEVFLQWVKGDDWKHYDQYLNLLTNRLRQEQKVSRNVREKAVLLQSWKTKEKEQNEKGVPL